MHCLRIFAVVALVFLGDQVMGVRIIRFRENQQKGGKADVAITGPHSGEEWWREQLRIGRVFASIIASVTFIGPHYDIGKQKQFFFSVKTMEGQPLDLKALGLANRTEDLTPKAILGWRPTLSSKHDLDPQAVSRIWVSKDGGDNTIYVTFKYCTDWDRVKAELVKPPIRVEYGGHRIEVNPWFWGLAVTLWTKSIRRELQELLQQHPGFSVWFSGESQGGAFAQACAFMFGIDQENRRKSGVTPTFTEADYRAVSFGSYRWLTEQGAMEVKKVLGPRLFGIVSSHRNIMDPYPGFPGRPYHEIPGLWKFEFGDKTLLREAAGGKVGVGGPPVSFAEDVVLLPCARSEPESVDNDLRDGGGKNCPPSSPPIPEMPFDWKGTDAQLKRGMEENIWPEDEGWFKEISNWMLGATNMHIGRGQHHVFSMTVAARAR